MSPAALAVASAWSAEGAVLAGAAVEVVAGAEVVAAAAVVVAAAVVEYGDVVFEPPPAASARQRRPIGGIARIRTSASCSRSSESGLNGASVGSGSRPHRACD